MPERIQLRRTKGWRMPPNTVSVARPTRWGNPFYVTRWRPIEMCISLFRMAMMGGWDPNIAKSQPDAHFNSTYFEHRAFLRKVGSIPAENARIELRGKNLACWCALDKPCHADVLLELANKPATSAGKE